MSSTASYWEQIYTQTPLALAPVHFANMRHSPFTMQYLTKVLSLCPEGGRACEPGFGSGYAAIWLSLRGVMAEGIDCSPVLVERARQANNILGGQAQFRTGDLFHLYQEDAPRYSVIHHQGVLERFTVPQIRAALAQQVASADWVVFSVASVFYPFEPEAGDERLLPLEEWERILAPFAVEELRYYGDPQHGEREHILCVLRGQEATPALKKRFTVAAFPSGISAIVHTRNEAAHIAECLETLRGWTDEILVCDMESTDGTVEIARTVADQVMAHPLIANFDRARNVSAMRANYRFIFYLDADERVPPELGKRLRDAALHHGEGFEAMLIPFRHHFAGRWLQCLYPGYTMPRLFKNGRFFFNTRLHAGAEVDGHTAAFPADNPDLALVHYSYSSMAHYLEKLNRYTDGEAANMHRDGQPFTWHGALRHFVLDLRDYYDRRGAYRDGPHGFAYSFLSGFYRFEQHIKLFEKRFQAQQLQQEELGVPQSVEQMLEYMLSVIRERPRPQAPAIQVRSADDAAPLVWSGPVLDPSGYGEESRHFAFALEKAGVSASVQAIPWSEDAAPLSEAQQATLRRMAERPAGPGFIQITHNFAPQFARHPETGVAIGRTLFETDRLPPSWVQACNRMDYVWVASEFNRETFAQAGVEAKKLVVIPECFDPAPFLMPSEPVPNRWTRPGEFTFLAVFDWTLHKGWDVLLKAFLLAFEGRDDCALLLKVWSTMGYSDLQIRQQAADFVRRELGQDLEADGRIRFVQERLSPQELIHLYRACDAFVLPSRGEGWGRPFMEAMACGKPVLATAWSGNTAFMTADNSYLFDYDLVSVPETGWREISTYQGHRWAEPRLEHVISQMRRVVEHPEESASIGRRAREEVTTRFSEETVGEIMAQEIARIQEARRPHPVLPEPAMEETPVRTEASADPTEQRHLRVRWEGVPFQWHSLAHVNREACRALWMHPGVELALIPTDRNEFDPTQEPVGVDLAPLCFARLSGPADIHVRHFFPPRLEKPDDGKFVLMQPWEYGFLPTRWIEAIQQNVDEVWCYSQYVRQVYLASGIAAEKLQVVPLGVDTTVFRPEAPPYVFTTEPGAAMLTPEGPKRFTFLFVGGTLDRKGIDILLEAYLKAFSAFDEVALIIKDTCTKTVYRGQNDQEKILAKVGDEFHAPLVYLEDDLSAHQLAGLYTAADCLVHL